MNFTGRVTASSIPNKFELIEKELNSLSPQEEGGLKFRDSISFNQTLLAKLVCCVLCSPLSY